MASLTLCRWRLIVLAVFIHRAAGWTLAAQPAPVPEQTALVVDQASALTTETREALNSRLQVIQASGRAQVAVLISSGIRDEALSEYALRVAEAWQLGRAKRDDGLLILIVPSINGARIEVGYGLEG